MATIEFKARLGNNILQFMSCYLFCEKHKINLNFDNEISNYQELDSIIFSSTNYEQCSEYLTPYSYNFSSLLNQSMIEELNKYDNIKYDEDIVIHDFNFFHFYDQTEINKNIKFSGFFRFRNLLQDNRDKLKKLFNIKYQKKNSDEVFIHYRLGDVNTNKPNGRLSVSVDYFESALNRINFSKGYISSDSINDDKCQYLIDKYNLIPITLPPYETIMFGKDFDNIIISGLSFSFLIGFFSDAKHIICPKDIGFTEKKDDIIFGSGLDCFIYI